MRNACFDYELLDQTVNDCAVPKARVPGRKMNVGFFDRLGENSKIQFENKIISHYRIEIHQIRTL